MVEKKLPKILAIYLPQFYENEDNNRWWGKGFTDWETVRTAEKYFPEHNAPRVPINREYYDLSKYETMAKQAKLAHQYGIDGFCFYHYYFQNGKKELELPAENLLKWKDINMPFCFNWASESWIRSWSKIEGNVWTEKYENDEVQYDNGVLVLQDYGDESAWEAHFEYLLPFFMDKRYIKIDGRPVFIFYSPNDITSLASMISCWRKLARMAGFPDLYLIGAHLDSANTCLDAAIIYEPRHALTSMNRQGKATINNGVRCFDYEMFWNEITDQAPIYGFKTYFCGVSGYDDTPRRGRSGECLIGQTPKKFKEGLTELIRKSTQLGNELLFINAWNEWGEGMYLEPDVENKYSYLEAINEAIQCAGNENESYKLNSVDNNFRNELIKLDYNSRKFKKLFNILDKWLFLQQDGRIEFKTVLLSLGINNVAIYGMSAIGKHLLVQLKKENIDVSFGIDQYVGQYGKEFTIYRPEDSFPQVDAIIVTAFDFEVIKDSLQNRYSGKIISIEEIIDRMMRG